MEIRRMDKNLQTCCWEPELSPTQGGTSDSSASVRQEWLLVSGYREQGTHFTFMANH